MLRRRMHHATNARRGATVQRPLRDSDNRRQHAVPLSPACGVIIIMARCGRASTGFTFHLHQGVVDVCD
jgi:hypothetical protein